MSRLVLLPRGSSSATSEMLHGWHDFQHAYFAAPRDRRGGRIPGVPAGLVGTVLRAMVRTLGFQPHLPVGDRDCRVCREAS